MYKQYRVLFSILLIIIVSLSLYLFYTKKIDQVDFVIPSSLSQKTEIEHTKTREKYKKSSLSSPKIKRVSDKNAYSTTKDLEASVVQEMTYSTPEAMQEYTDSIYASLQPQDYAEIIQEADTAFEDLNRYIERSDQKLSMQMQLSEEDEDRDMSVEIENNTYKMELPHLD